MNIKRINDTFNIELSKYTIYDIAPVLVWRYEGQDWNKERALPKTVIQIKNGYQIAYSFECLDAEITILTEDNRMTFSGKILNNKNLSVELARFNIFEGKISGDEWNFKAFAYGGGPSKVFKSTDTVPPLKQYLEELWKSYEVSWERLDDLYHMEPNWASSCDVACIDKLDEQITLGFYSPNAAFGEIGFRTCMESDSSIYAAVMLDNILFEHGDERLLESVALINGDLTLGIKDWIELCARDMNPRKSDPYMGFCSWYQGYCWIDSNFIRRAITEYKDMSLNTTKVLVQLDDAFQKYPGSWSEPNSRFEDGFKEFPKMITDNGCVPGLWLAPTAIWTSHPFAIANPDALQKKADGSPAITFNNWSWCTDKDDVNTTTYLELGHPKVDEFIKNIIKDAVADGWKYLKIDFTYAISTVRVAYQRKKTTYELLRDLYLLIREAAGEDIIICACVGGLFRYTIGVVDTQRIGGDVLPNIKSIRQGLSDCILRAMVGGKWFTVDTDVFYMRKGTELSFEESWIWTGTVGILGSVFITSDFPTQWSEEERARVDYFWRDGGVVIPNIIKTVQEENGDVLALYVKSDDYLRVCVYNWNDFTSDIVIDISSFGIDGQPKRAFPDDVKAITENGFLNCKAMLAHSMRIIEF